MSPSPSEYALKPSRITKALAWRLVSKAHEGSKKGYIPGESLPGSTWQKESVHVLAKFMENETAITEV
jgi:hypothetical protein